MRFIWLSLILLAVCFASFPVSAHPLGEVVQETTVQNEGARILIIYKTAIGPSITATLVPDANRDGKVTSVEEADLALAIHKILYPNIEVVLDGKPVVIDLYYDSVAPAVGGYNNGLRLNLIYSVSIAPDSVSHNLKITDHNFRAGELKWLKWFVQAEPGVSKVVTTGNSRTLDYAFTNLAAGANNSQSTLRGVGGIDSNNALAPEPKENSSQATLREYLSRENLGTGTVLFALGMAFILGMGHALSPGHGKAMVAAYLIGRSGKIKDACTLGIIVTITHVSSVIVLGVVALLLSRYFLPGALYPWLGAFSGVLVFLVGYIMLAKRALHGHHHNHTHDHDPSEESGAVSWWSMLSLGIAGGMVPCPTALVVLLAAVALGRIFFGFMLILAFSFGLAAVLILIGILTVRASKLTEKFSGSHRWIENLPVASGGLVMIAGIAITLNALSAGGILKFFP
ncbi:nickel/cobalt transporter [Desulfovibrio gilichinskyi]|uniref:Nickel/cobalt efflux system n=1 Tax=Desulfovibrio gilichinskyi TaxID=1519643 RepID=A0A1X7C0B8_9BACT|nr:sulfite exporter TauE/SafE family protein [Desulfovibrio gilichinskyi]SME87716.1 ABC-type nickel/cobalt efflux system, permease component RcnA [Desulfovibrio gilichinskyi]